MSTAGFAPSSIVITTPLLAARIVADEMAGLIQERQRTASQVVFGVASGRTPIPLYDELSRRVRDGGLSFGNVLTFNLDEYVGYTRHHPQSLHTYLRTHLFDRVGITEAAARAPETDGVNAQAADCAAYERAIAEAGGIDLLILGIGRNGHIGFNEPGSSRHSITRVVELERTTREDAAASFGSIDLVPTHGVTMGVATMLAARRVRLFAFGSGKRDIVERMAHTPVSAALPATYLRDHPDVKVWLDADAAAGLTPAGSARRPGTVPPRS